MMEAAGRNAVCAAFIFLDLLEGHAERFGERDLAHIGLLARDLQSGRDVFIDGEGSAGHNGHSKIIRLVFWRSIADCVPNRRGAWALGFV